MLTNRNHQNRWSLEQNQQVPINEEPNQEPRQDKWKRFCLNFIGLLLASMVTLIIWRICRLHLGRFESVFALEDDLDMDGAIMVQDHRENEAHGVLLPVIDARKEKINSSDRFAYVSLLCDASMIPSARVLTYALKRAKAAFPIVILVPSDDIPGLDEIIELGAIIHKVSLLPTLFTRSNGKKPSLQKMCRYSKIHAWSLTQYTKIVFLDISLLVVNNIDEMFQFPEFSAVKAVGDEFNTAVFVMVPSIMTFEAMLTSYLKAPPNYLGEQGFLNWFFLNRPSQVISARYNTVLRQKDYAVWPLLRRNAKVFHFVPQTTPWNYYRKASPEWDLNFEPIIFYYWYQMHAQAVQSLQRAEYSPTTSWSNLRRVPDLCAPHSTSYTPKKFAIHNKFSVLIGTWDRIPILRKLIQHYQKSRLVHKIYVTWHNPSVKPPEDFAKTFRKKPPVEILTQKYDSLNNRFNPIPGLETRALLVCDDDIRVNITDIEYAFDVWRSRPYSLVGVFPRYHAFHPENNTFTYEIRSPERPRLYSIMLTKFMFMNAEYLYTYTCLLPVSIHRYIDDHMNCEDIAMNMLVTGMTGAKPAAVLLHVDDFGTTSGISGKVGHLNSRSQCMTDLIKLFGKDTLLYNREVFLPFHKRRT